MLLIANTDELTRLRRAFPPPGRARSIPLLHFVFRGDLFIFIGVGGGGEESVEIIRGSPQHRTSPGRAEPAPRAARPPRLRGAAAARARRCRRGRPARPEGAGGAPRDSPALARAPAVPPRPAFPPHPGNFRSWAGAGCRVT